MHRSMDLKGPSISLTEYDHHCLEIGHNSISYAKAIRKAMNPKKSLNLEIGEKEVNLQN